jgi:hypothetical protein
LIMLDLACGSLRLMQRILKGELIKNIVWVFIAFNLLPPWM